MFDYTGLTAEVLTQLCNEKSVLKTFLKPKYALTEYYSQGVLYRDFAKFPSWLPLCVFSEHGIGSGIVPRYEIDNDAQAMFVFTSKKLEKYRMLTYKPCYKVMHPFVWYRQNNKISRDENAIGTLAFPSHSTINEEWLFDIDRYVADLKKLPSRMHPVCICLHMFDIQKGQHIEFIKRGMPVYTAGHVADGRFAGRFYDILKHFKYTTSNIVGSYAYYSVDLDIPFSLYGEEGTCFNTSDVGDSQFPKGKQDISSPEHLTAKRIFFGLNYAITDEQRAHVVEKLGCEGGLSRDEMRHIFWISFVKQHFTLVPVLRYTMLTGIRCVCACIPMRSVRGRLRSRLIERCRRIFRTV